MTEAFDDDQVESFEDGSLKTNVNIVFSDTGEDTSAQFVVQHKANLRVCGNGKVEIDRKRRQGTFRNLVKEPRRMFPILRGARIKKGFQRDGPFGTDHNKPFAVVGNYHKFCSQKGNVCRPRFEGSPVPWQR